MKDTVQVANGRSPLSIHSTSGDFKSMKTRKIKLDGMEQKYRCTGLHKWDSLFIYALETLERSLTGLFLRVKNRAVPLAFDPPIGRVRFRPAKWESLPNKRWLFSRLILGMLDK